MTGVQTCALPISRQGLATAAWKKFIQNAHLAFKTAETYQTFNKKKDTGHQKDPRL